MNPNGDVEAWTAVLSDPDSEPIPSMSPFGAVLMLAPLRTRIGSETETTNLPTSLLREQGNLRQRAAKQRYGSIQSLGLTGPSAGDGVKSETGTDGDR